MPSLQDNLQALVELSQTLGRPELDLAILGEGNTSVKNEDGTFFVKASGSSLGTLRPEDLVQVDHAAALAMLDGPDLSDQQITDALIACKVDDGQGRPSHQARPSHQGEKSSQGEDDGQGRPSHQGGPSHQGPPHQGKMPSVETTFHSYLLSIPGVNFVGHTHPIAVNAILCSRDPQEIIRGRLFPDEIVCCGIAPAFLPYVDPGLPLAREMRRVVQDYMKEYETRPKAILMQNHGLIALGGSPKEVLSITLMWVKTARILAGTFAFGGPRYFSEANVRRIYTRPDEAYRIQSIAGAGAKL